MKISLICGSRNRPQMLMEMIRSFNSLAKNKDDIEFLIYVDNDDNNTLNIVEEIGGNVRAIVGPRVILGKICNKIFPHTTGELLFLVADDIKMECKNWDEYLWNNYKKYEDQIVLLYGPDQYWHDKLATHLCLSRKWIETIGYVVPGLFEHGNDDLWLFEIGKIIGRNCFIPEMGYHHYHHSFGDREFDQTDFDQKELFKIHRPDKKFYYYTEQRQKDAMKLLRAMKK